MKWKSHKQCIYPLNPFVHSWIWIFFHLQLVWNTSIPVFIHQDPFVYIKIHGFFYMYLHLDYFSHSWICGFLSFSAAPCSLGIVHDELIVFNPNLKNYLTQLLFDIFGFRLDHCCIVDSAIHFSTLFFKTIKVHFYDWHYSWCMCVRNEILVTEHLMCKTNGYFYFYVALRYIFVFLHACLVMYCIKCLLYGFQVLIHYIYNVQTGLPVCVL